MFHIKTKNNKIYKSDIIVFSIFLMIYMTIGTRINLPFQSGLRWIGSFMLLITALGEKLLLRHRIKILPTNFYLLFISMFISIFTLRYALMYGIARFISFLLVCVAIYMYFDRKSMSKEYMIVHFSLFSKIVNLFMVYQLILYFLEGLPSGPFKGIYGNQNMLVSVAIVGVVCSLWLLYIENKNKFLYKLFFITDIIIVILTNSRAGFVCLIFILIIISSLNLISVKSLNIISVAKLVIKGVVFLSIIIFIIKNIEIPALQRILDGSTDGSTGLTRDDVWIGASQIIKERQMFGWGYGAMGYHVFVNNPTGYYWGVHNSYLGIIIENGYLGSILYVIFFAIPIIKTIKNIKRKKDIKERLILTILLLLCMTLLLNAVAESFLFSVGNPVSVYFWLTFIFLITYMDKYKVNEREDMNAYKSKCNCTCI